MFETSLSIKELSTALSKFQGQIKNAKKTETNPFFKSKYAGLETIWDAVRKELSDNGLSLSQFPTGNDELVSLLLHSSGEWIKSTMKMSPVDNKPQSQGSAITYARRYAMSAILGIASEDDDGVAAGGTGEVKKQNTKDYFLDKISKANFAELKATRKLIEEAPVDKYTSLQKEIWFKVIDDRMQKLIPPEK